MRLNIKIISYQKLITVFLVRLSRDLVPVLFPVHFFPFFPRVHQILIGELITLRLRLAILTRSSLLAVFRSNHLLPIYFGNMVFLIGFIITY
jgi:hypothetical protein